MSAEQTLSGRTGRRALSQIAEILSHRVFRWWFISQVLSASGAMTQTVALSWLVLEQTHSALWLGMITISAWAPLLVLGPWAGAVVDSLDRRRLLITTQSLFIVVGLSLSLLTHSQPPPLVGLFVLAAVSGFVTAFDGPARQVYVADIVGHERIAAAVSLYEVTINASRVLGPALGGVLLATVGAWACFFANALAFLPPLGVLLANGPGAGTIATSRREPRAVRKGLTYVARSPQIRACLPIAAASGMLFNLGVALPVFASRTLHLGAAGMALSWRPSASELYPVPSWRRGQPNPPGGRCARWLWPPRCWSSVSPGAPPRPWPSR